MSGIVIRSSTGNVVSLDACRCWTHHRCGCLYADDCPLARPLPVHGPQPCGGEFTGDGFASHCQEGTA